MESDVISRLFNQMRSYALTHTLTASQSSRVAYDDIIKVEKISGNELLEELGIPILEQLRPYEWGLFTDQVTAHFDGKKERAGVHPRLRQILSAASKNKTYQWTYEQEFLDEDGVVTEPDLALFINGRRLSHLEAEVVGRLLRGAQQSEGYFVSQLLDEIELLGALDAHAVIRGVCLASDGMHLRVSIVQVSVDGGLAIRRLENPGFELWTQTGHPQSEPFGVRLLRSLLASPPSVWLDVPEPQIFSLNTGVAHATSVLGRGAFCSALACTHSASGHALCIKKWLYTTTNRAVRTDQVAQLARERAVLATFSGDPAARIILPTLHPDSPTVSDLSPFIAMFPAGTSLRRLAGASVKDRRRNLVPQLVSDVLSGLSAAHRLGYCHSDMRPGNVIWVEATNRFMVIDWGLARREGDPLHKYRGGVPFFAAALLRAIKLKEGAIPYMAEYDRESVKYVAYAFLVGGRLEPAEWSDMSVATLVASRAVDLNSTGVAELQI